MRNPLNPLDVQWKSSDFGTRGKTIKISMHIIKKISKVLNKKNKTKKLGVWGQGLFNSGYSPQV